MSDKIEQLKKTYEELAAVFKKAQADIEFLRNEYTDDGLVEMVQIAANDVGVSRKKKERLFEAYNQHCEEVEQALRTYHSQQWERMKESETEMLYARNAYLQAVIEGTN